MTIVTINKGEFVVKTDGQADRNFGPTTMENFGLLNDYIITLDDTEEENVLFSSSIYDFVADYQEEQQDASMRA